MPGLEHRGRHRAVHEKTSREATTPISRIAAIRVLCLELNAVKLFMEWIMARKTAVLGFSVSPALAKEYERLAEREGTTKSDLFVEW